MARALTTQRLRRSFRGFVAVDDVSLGIEAGARHALIGPNGAGKTTLINLLTGVLRADAGEVMLGPERITHLPPHARVRRGRGADGARVRGARGVRAPGRMR